MPGFPSVDVFMYLMQSQLEKLRGPVIDCLSEVHSYLEDLAHKIINRVFQRFPTLVSEMNSIATFVLNRERENTRDIVESIITAEEGYVFTNDNDYLTQRTDIIPKAEAKAAVQKSAENLFVSEIRNRIDSYFKIVVRNVRDTVPKVVGYFLVRTIMDKMQLELYEQINHSENIINHLSEPAYITAERDSLKKQLETLKKAEKILKHNPEFAKQTDNIAKEMAEQEENFRREQEEKRTGKKEVKEVKQEKQVAEVKQEKQVAEVKQEKQVPVVQNAPEPAKNVGMFGAAVNKAAEAPMNNAMFGAAVNKAGDAGTAAMFGAKLATAGAKPAASGFFGAKP